MSEGGSSLAPLLKRVLFHSGLLALARLARQRVRGVVLRYHALTEGRALVWGYERQLRIWESQVHSIIGVAGCVYAMRRSLYQPLDAGAISDFIQPGKVTERGHRTVLEPAGIAY